MKFEEYCKQDKKFESIIEKIKKGNKAYQWYVRVYRGTMLVSLLLGILFFSLSMSKQKEFIIVSLVFIIIFFCLILMISASYCEIPPRPYKTGRFIAAYVADIKEYEFDYLNEFLKEKTFDESFDILNIGDYQTDHDVYILIDGEECKINISGLSDKRKKTIFDTRKIHLLCSYRIPYWTYYDDCMDVQAWPASFVVENILSHSNNKWDRVSTSEKNPYSHKKI